MVDRTKANDILIWKHTHPDFRGRLDGEPNILRARPGGTHIVPITALTDEEYASGLDYATRRQERGLKPYR